MTVEQSAILSFGYKNRLLELPEGNSRPGVAR